MVDIRSLLFPPKCVFCGRILKDDELEVCADCRKNVRISDSVSRVSLTEGCVAPLRYENEVRRAVLRFKYHGKTGYAAPFARYMEYALSKAWTPSWELVTFAVSNPTTVRKRGYNQAELLARELAKHYKVPAVSCLRKKRDTAPMNTLNPAQRAANISGAFEICCDPAEIKGKTVLLTDDILTTGVTLTESARTLLNAGAARIYCVVCAKSVSKIIKTIELY